MIICVFVDLMGAASLCIFFFILNDINTCLFKFITVWKQQNYPIQGNI